MPLNLTNCTQLDTDKVVTPAISDNQRLLATLAVLLCLLDALTLFFNVVLIASICRSSLRCGGGGAGGGGLKGGSGVGGAGGNNTRVVKLLVTSMAAADAVVATVIMPERINEIIHNGRWVLPLDECKYRAIVSVYMCTVSIYHVVCMAVDRYLAICRPLSYRLLTIKTGFIMAGACWAIPVFIYPLPVLSEWVIMVKAHGGCIILNSLCRNGRLEFFTLMGAILSFYLPFSLIFLIYFRVLIEVRKFQNRRRSMTFNGRKQNQVSEITNTFKEHQLSQVVIGESNFDGQLGHFHSETSGKTNDNVVSNKQTNMAYSETHSRRKSGTKRKNKKALLSIGLIVISFTVCWLPFAVYMEIFASNVETEFPSWFPQFTMWLGYFNSTLNPVLFCFHRGIRTAVRRFLFSM